MAKPRISVLGASGTPLQNGSYHYGSGVTGVFAVPAGSFIKCITCWATGAGASVQIGGLDTVLLPPGGTVEMNVDCGLEGPTNITFAGTGGYLVEMVAG